MPEENHLHRLHFREGACLGCRGFPLLTGRPCAAAGSGSGGFPYGSFLPSKLGPVNGGKYTFRIAGDQENYELEIEGPVSAARYAIDKLCSGKRELLRANDASISAIHVRVVPFKKSEK